MTARPGRRLDHVRWLGGATGAGKTAVAARLAEGFGLRVYSTDATIGAHAADPGADAPLLSAFRRMSMDERWLRRDAKTMLETFPWFAGERFDRIIGDLQARPGAPLTLAEGFRLLPRLVEPQLAEPWHALFVTTTPDFRRRAFARRAAAVQFWRHTSDPAAALERLLERDQLFADRVAREAAELGLGVMTIDGTRTEAAVVDEAAASLRLTGPSR